jgi:hypothetical protein
MIRAREKKEIELKIIGNKKKKNSLDRCQNKINNIFRQFETKCENLGKAKKNTIFVSVRQPSSL